MPIFFFRREMTSRVPPLFLYCRGGQCTSVNDPSASLYTMEPVYAVYITVCMDRNEKTRALCTNGKRGDHSYGIGYKLKLSVTSSEKSHPGAVVSSVIANGYMMLEM